MKKSFAVLTAAVAAVCGVLRVEARESARPQVISERGGALVISAPQVRFGLRIVYPKWIAQANADGSLLSETDGTRRFGFSGDKDHPAVAKAKGTLRVTPGAQDGVDVCYAVDFPEGVETSQIGLQAEVPVQVFAGGSLIADGAEHPIPRVTEKPVFSGRLERAEFRSAAGRPLFTLTFREPSVFTFMSRPKESSRGYTIRIPFFGSGTVAAGTSLTCAFSVSGPQGFEVHDGTASRRQAGADWIPFMPDSDIFAGSACDYSALRGEVKPCGAYGRVIANGPHFEFEGRPGKVVRFYGANLCFDACYPEEGKADRLVGLLARAGYNAIRLHHYDRMLTCNSADATELDAGLIARLDYFLSRCYAAGLYVTTDFHIGRTIPRKAVGLGEKGLVGQQEFKQLSFTNALLRANFRRYVGNFLNHVNPHTGRRYADEPGLFAIAFVNEGTPGKRVGSSETARRLAEMESRSAADWKRFVREDVKSKVLLSNMSNGWSPAVYQLPRTDVYDYVDSHFYVDHPQFPERSWRLPWKFGNANSIRNPIGYGMPRIALTRLFDRPFVSTEYNFTAPNRYRMMGALLTGAAAAAQDWGGVWRFEWSMNAADVVSLDWAEPFRATGFDTPGDPLQLVGEGLFAALFLRGDLAPLKRTAVLTISRRALVENNVENEPNLKTVCWTSAGWRAQIGTLVTEKALPDGMHEWTYPSVFGRTPEAIVDDLPKDPAIAVDPVRGSFAVATPRTCALFSEEGPLSAGALTANVRLAPAAVWVVSLDGEPLARTSRALLVHATDVQSTDMPQTQLGSLYVFGHGVLPYLMRSGRAEVTLTVARPEPPGDRPWKVYALSPGGRRLREVPYAFGDDGRMRLVCETAAEPSCATFLYELVR